MDPNFHPIHPALRVAQLDVEDLENSIEDTALEQHRKYLQAASVVDTGRYEQEALFLYRTLFWWAGCRDNGATLGQKMMGVLYENFGTAPILVRSAHYVLSVVFPYVRSRLQNTIATVCKDRCLADTLERSLFYHLDTFLQILSLLNHIRFLNCGDYRNLVERILRLHVVHRKRPSISESDYSSMNRELLWNVFADVVTFLLPLLKFRRYWLRIRRKLDLSSRRSKSDSIEEEPTKKMHEIDEKTETSLDEILDTPAKKKNTSDNDRKIFSRETKCTFCHNSPVIPCHIGCDHVYCYYCLAANMQEDENFCCPECDYSAYGSRIKAIKFKKCS